MALGLAATFVLAAALPLETLARLFQDDALFYLTIARHFAEGAGSTFDGLHRTNGYHPLWMLVLSVVHRGLPLAGESGLRIALAFHGVLIAAALLLAARFLAAAQMPPRLRLCVLVAMWAGLGLANVAMEAALWHLAFWSFALAALRLCEREAPGGAWLLCAAAVVACYLTRSDSILFLVPMGAVVNLTVARREGWGPAIARGAAFLWVPLGLAGAAQVAANVHYFGHAKTISSTIKVSGINFGFELLRSSDGRLLQSLVHRGIFLGFLAAALAGLAVLALSRASTPVREHVRRLLAGANAYIVLFLGAALLTLREPPRTWYYTVSVAVVLATWAFVYDERTRARSGREAMLPAYAATALAAALMVASLLVQYGGTKRQNSLAAASWLRQNLGPGQAAFVVDGSGILKYFSERPVIDGDGLVNDFEFKRVVEERRLEEYFRANRVEVVVANVNRDAVRAEEMKLYTANWPSSRAYAYASVPRAKALADFTAEGFFGFMPFRTADLRFAPPQPPAPRPSP